MATPLRVSTALPEPLTVMPKPAAVAICAAVSERVSLAPSTTPLNAREAPLT
ncbi:hypothetical protein D3C78_672990 [compost metagenome]